MIAALLDAPIYAYHPDPADAACQVELMRRDGATGIVGTWLTATAYTPRRQVWTVVVGGQPESAWTSAELARYALLARLVVG